MGFREKVWNHAPFHLEAGRQQAILLRLSATRRSPGSETFRSGSKIPNFAASQMDCSAKRSSVPRCFANAGATSSGFFERKSLAAPQRTEHCNRQGSVDPCDIHVEML